MGRSQRSVSSHAGHVTTETVYGQTLALRLGNGDEHHPLELDRTGQFVKENLILYLYLVKKAIFTSFHIKTKKHPIVKST